MSAKTIYDSLEMIAKLSPKEKIGAINKAFIEEDFRNFVCKALDPAIRYGAVYSEDWTNLPEGEEDIDFLQIADEPNYEMLLKMARGEVSSRDEAERMAARLTHHSRSLLKRLLNKDLRIGAGVETVNKAVPGAIPVFKCMLAHPYEESRVKRWPVAVQPKLDGIRVLGIGGKDDQFVFYTRTGKEVTSLDHINTALRSMLLVADENEKVVLDGEVVTSTFNDTVSKVRKKSEQAVDAVFHIFDIIPLSSFRGSDKYEVQLAKRLNWLKKIEATIGELGIKCVAVVPTTFAANNAEVVDAYNAIRDKGGEGVIVKPLEGVYEKRRSYNWLKIKDCQSVDVKVVGFEEGTGKYVGMLGALIVDYKGVHVKVGSGLTDVLRVLIWRDKEEWLGKLIEVEFHEVTPDGSLRHPRFVKDRTGDKPEEDGV